ncbi:hypothetical protein LTR78_003589 [Recurvomyces mirabilis]|uniref:Enoyl reductase (ER) domain-containing protein n=1 Tax=Recurvomyces mirabilis TaxID=574656 RepID=A0AAE0WR78_9PEZI|nr:hypothetical protein LTR78_003589 [Recurvomyces mirabilis]KAK5154704.1 hypothetical protein LTS14_006283 [Recurvomyces mirabilis]
MTDQDIKTEAWVARADNKLNLETVTYLPPGPKEVLVSIIAASVCHSDVRAAQGTFHLKPPLILGHEGSGYVQAVGSEVTYVKPGNAVVLAYSSCGECRRCQAGKAAYCLDLFGLNFSGRREDGVNPVKDAMGEGVNGLFFGQSSMARVALVRERSCVKISTLCSKDELRMFAALGCGVQTGAGAMMNVAKPTEGSRIVVFGGGAVGLSAIAAARPTKPECLVLVDNSSVKLNMIPKELLEGVTVLDSSTLPHEDLVSKLKSLTLDGNEAVATAAYECLDKMGMVMNIGGSATAQPKYAVERNLVNGLTIRGTHQGDSVPRDMIPKLIEMWREGKFPFDKLLTPFRFEGLKHAMAEMHAGRAIKAILYT